MNKLYVPVVIALLISCIVIGILASQTNIFSPHQETPTPTPTPSATATGTPQPTGTVGPSPSPTPTQNYSTVTFTWYLQPELINNVTWLSQSYNETLSWTENYVKLLAAQAFYYYPNPLSPPDDTVFVSASIDLNDGFTTAVYLYREYTGYVEQDYGHQYTVMNLLEAFGTHTTVICDARGFTMTFA